MKQSIRQLDDVRDGRAVVTRQGFTELLRAEMAVNVCTDKLVGMRPLLHHHHITYSLSSLLSADYPRSHTSVLSCIYLPEIHIPSLHCRSLVPCPVTYLASRRDVPNAYDTNEA